MRRPAQRSSTVGAVGGGELVQAAEEIADGARKNAQSWSKTGAVVRSVHTEQQDERTVLIVADADAAYPNETGSRHPVYARGEDRRKATWTAANDRPFTGPAADERAGDAMAKYATKVDRMCRERGFSADRV